MWRKWRNPFLRFGEIRQFWSLFVKTDAATHTQQLLHHLATRESIVIKLGNTLQLEAVVLSFRPFAPPQAYKLKLYAPEPGRGIRVADDEAKTQRVVKKNTYLCNRNSVKSIKAQIVRPRTWLRRPKLNELSKNSHLRATKTQ